MDVSTLTSAYSMLIEQIYWLPAFSNLVVKSTLILLITFFLSVLLRGSSACTRHLLWFTSLFVLLFLPIFMRWVPTIEIPVTLQAEVSSAQAQVFSPIEERPGAAEEGMFLVEASLWVYFFGALSIILYSAYGILRLAKISIDADKYPGSSPDSVLKEMLEEECIGHNVEIKVSSQISSPLSWGLFTPLILLPLSALEWGEERLKKVIVHELSHIERFDWLILVMGKIVLSCYWYNPFLWLALRKLNEESELASDDAVVLAHDSSDYADTLVTLAREAKQGVFRRAVSDTFAKALAQSFLGRRVVSILNGGLVRTRTESLFLIRAILVGFPLVALIASLRLVPQVLSESSYLNYSSSGYLNVVYVNAEDVGYDTGANRVASVNELPTAQKPVRSIFDDLPPVPVIELFVSRSAIEPYLEAAQLSEESLPQVTLEQLGIEEKPVPGRTLINRVYPEYPVSAQRQGIEGYTVVEYLLSPTGHVLEPRIIDSGPSSIFNRVSLDAIMRYRFTPQSEEGESTSSPLSRQTRFTFQLQPEPG